MELSDSASWICGSFKGQYIGNPSSGSIRSHNIYQIKIMRGVITNVKFSENKPQISSAEPLIFREINDIYMHESDLSFGEESESNWNKIKSIYRVEVHSYIISPKHYDHDRNIVYGDITGEIIANVYERDANSSEKDIHTDAIQSSAPRFFGNKPPVGCLTQKISILAIVSLLNYNNLDILSIFNLNFFTLSFVELPSDEVYYDSDRDGIIDSKDKCPKVAEDYDNFEDEDGCPDIDNDGDGVSDLYDKCINIFGPVENEGCPFPSEADESKIDDKFSDPDNDGIPNYLDKCPLEAETINNYNDQDGCPDTVPQELQELLGIQDIFFETRTATLRPESIACLEETYKKLKEDTTIQLKIEGHTDSVGSMKFNQELSENRANTVRDWLIEKGIGRKRVKTIGFSYTKPIADNNTELGRQKNRRVNFTLMVPENKEKLESLPNLDEKQSVE